MFFFTLEGSYIVHGWVIAHPLADYLLVKFYLAVRHGILTSHNHQHSPFLRLLSAMEVKHVLLFFLSQGTICSWVFAAGEDFTSRSGYFIKRENKRFVGYVVKRFVSASFMSCSQSCLRNPWCSSTNFKVSSEMDGKGTCMRGRRRRKLEVPQRNAWKVS